MGDSGQQHTAGALAQRSREVAQWMAGQGLAAGDTVAVLMENRVEILELVLAARLAGLYAVVISTHLTAPEVVADEDRKSTRLNSSHSQISYAVFCLKKKKKNTYTE